MSKTKEFKVKWKGKEEKVVIKKMGYAEKCDFRDRFVETKIVGKIAQMFVHPFRMKLEALKKCTIEAPFDVNQLDNIIEEEEEEVLEEVYKEIESFNRLNPSERKNSDGDSNMEQATSN